VQFLFDRFAEAPAATAFVDRDRKVTYGEVLASIADYERSLEGAGVPRGAVVVVLGDYSPEVFCFLMALSRRACVAVPVTPASVVERETVEALSEAGFTAEFAPGEREPRITATGRTPTNPMLTGFLATGRPGLILFSSGSTGTPKAILHDLAQVAAKFEKRGAPIVSIAFLMLDHFGGINTILAITSGLGTVVTIGDRSVAGVCRAVERHKVEVLPTTPSFLGLLARSDLGSTFDLGSLRRITYGTEVMPQPTLDRLRKLFPDVQLHQTYGLSELGVLRSQSRPDGSLWVRVGGQGFETKVVDGILWIRSAYSMVGYLNAPSPFDAEGWFNTQDQVEVDGEWLRILGRVTDLINVAGQKVYPAEIEEHILELDNVEDVAVHGERHALLGQIVVARVVTREPETVDSLKQRIRKHCAQKLAPFKVPSKVVLAEAGLYSSRLKKVRREG
jgi:acyl-CoA synthetase (AMP-forming)/AMP-acid ligase II